MLASRLVCAGLVDEREGGGAEGGEGAHQRFLAKSRVLRPSQAQRKGTQELVGGCVLLLGGVGIGWGWGDGRGAA